MDCMISTLDQVHEGFGKKQSWFNGMQMSTGCPVIAG